MLPALSLHRLSNPFSFLAGVLVFVLCSVGVQGDRVSPYHEKVCEQSLGSVQSPQLDATTAINFGVQGSLRWRNAKTDDDEYSDFWSIAPPFTLCDGAAFAGHLAGRPLQGVDAKHSTVRHRIHSARAPPLA